MATREERLRLVTHAAHDLVMRERCAYCRGHWLTILATNVDRFLDGRDDFDRLSQPEEAPEHGDGCPLKTGAPPGAQIIDYAEAARRAQTKGGR